MTSIIPTSARSDRSVSPAALLAACAAALLTGACETPPPMKIVYDLSSGPAQSCPAQTCAGIAITCNTVLSVRILDPAAPRDPEKPDEDNALVSVCQRIEASTNPDEAPTSLCGMNQVNLPPDQLPARRLVIQVALYNADDITSADGELQCPTDLRFDANNLAIASRHRPAVAGQGYFTPGDAETKVLLGCNDLLVINSPTCRGEDRFRVTASADDFDSGVFLQPPVAQNVALLVGEPRGSLDTDSQLRYRLPYPSLTPLQMVHGSLPPAWSAELRTPFTESVCVVVEEKQAESTSSVSCRRVMLREAPLDLRALRLARGTLTTVLNAIGEPSFPRKGLVIGMVVDSLGKPVKDAVVRPSSGSVQYLSEGRDQITGSATSSNGIFISEDTPYTTSWSAPNTSGGYGGLIEDHVTVVILQPDAQIN